MGPSSEDCVFCYETEHDTRIVVCTRCFGLSGKSLNGRQCERYPESATCTTIENCSTCNSTEITRLSIQVCYGCAREIRQNLENPRVGVFATITDLIETYLPTTHLDEILGILRQEIQRRRDAQKAHTLMLQRAKRERAAHHRLQCMEVYPDLPVLNISDYESDDSV